MKDYKKYGWLPAVWRGGRRAGGVADPPDGRPPEERGHRRVRRGCRSIGRGAVL